MGILQAWRPFVFGLTLLGLSACQGANFGSSGGNAKDAPTGNKNADDRSEDQLAAGTSDPAKGADTNAPKSASDLGTQVDDTAGSGGGDQLAGPLPDSACKFFGKTQAAEVLPGGPNTPVKPAALNGTLEGDTYHFELAAYQGCYGAEAKNNRGDATPHTLSTYVSQITGVFFGGEAGNAIGEASAAGYASQCGSAR